MRIILFILSGIIIFSSVHAREDDFDKLYDAIRTGNKKNVVKLANSLTKTHPEFLKQQDRDFLK